MSQHGFIVQFPHPGGEHIPGSDDMPWNTGSHKRKFMATRGIYIDDREVSHQGEIVFWGEFEAQSRVVSRWPAQPSLPTVLHEPYLGVPPEGVVHQNTDPWVFGDRFHYSNCKQLTNHESTMTAIQQLTFGSLILFGSSVEGDFVLDTAFVVGGNRGTYKPRNFDHLDVDPSFRTATLASLEPFANPERDVHLTLFDGATPEAPQRGMWSFVPALPRSDTGPRFARPKIELPGLINPKSLQSTRGSTRPVTLDEVRTAWESVKQQVFDQDLVLATRLELRQEARWMRERS